MAVHNAKNYEKKEGLYSSLTLAQKEKKKKLIIK
jgi:hypothetical protein